MSHVDSSPLSMYNSLSDPHLAGYFANTKMRNHLRRSGLISKRGEIVSENSYRLNMARKEHKKHVKDLLAQAIVHKTLDLERHRQVAIRKKLEEIAKIELVQQMKDGRSLSTYNEALLPLLTPTREKGRQQGASRSAGGRVSHRSLSPRSPHAIEEEFIITETTQRQRRNDEDLLPYLSPRSSRPHSGPSPRSHRSNGLSKCRPISAPSNMPDTNSSVYESNDEEVDITYVDDDGNPIDWPDSVRGRSRTPRSREEIDARHLYSLNPAALRRYASTLARMEQTNSLISPYLTPQVPLPPSSPRTAPPRYRGLRTRSTSSDKSPKRSPGRDLHRQEPPMRHKGDNHSMCQVKMKYHGWALNLARETRDPRQEIIVEQQHCGGNTLTVFRDLLVPGSTFTFTSKRHLGYPFSLTLYVDGRQDCRVSTCCEFGHTKKVRLGGKMGHFSIVGIGKMTPCYKCQIKKGIRGPKAPKKQKRLDRDNTGEEVIVMDTVSKEKSAGKKKDATAQEEEESDEYEDDFDDDEDEKKEEDEVLYSRDWESSKQEDAKGMKDQVVESEPEDKRQIRGLPDELMEDSKEQKATSVSAEKPSTPSKLDFYEEDKNRKVEGYSDEEEDLEGEKSKTVAVERNPDASPIKPNGKHPKSKRIIYSATTGQEQTASPDPTLAEDKKYSQAQRQKSGGRHPRHPRILTPAAAETLNSADPSEKQDKTVLKPRTPSPPQSAKLTQLKTEEDRDADYSSSSESESSVSSSSDDEAKEDTPRAESQGQKDAEVEDKGDVSEPGASCFASDQNLPSLRSTTSESTLPSSLSPSSGTETERKPSSLPERPISPVAATLMKEEEEDEKKQKREQSSENESESESESESSGQKEVQGSPALNRTTPEDYDHSKGKESENARGSRSSSSQSSDSETDTSTPRPVEGKDVLQNTEDQTKRTNIKTVTSSSSSGSETERSESTAGAVISPVVANVEETKTGGVARKYDGTVSSSLSESTVSDTDTSETSGAVATSRQKDETTRNGLESSQHDDTGKPTSTGPAANSVVPAVEPVMTGPALPPVTHATPDVDTHTDKDNPTDTDRSEKKFETSATETADSSSDSSSDSFSSSSDEESESEGELIVQSDTDRVHQPVALETTKSDNASGQTNETNLKNQAQRAGAASELAPDNSSGTPAVPPTEESPPPSPPHSLKQDEQQPLVPSVVVIPNTPEVLEKQGGQEDDDLLPQRPKTSRGLPDKFEYKPNIHSTSDNKSSDGDGHVKHPSESEAEADTNHGGNDPDNVAENDSANWHGSMEYIRAPEQKPHPGSLTSLLDNKDDIDIQNISLTKPQLVELLQSVEMKSTIHTLTISNASLGMEEIQMLLQSLSRSLAKPTVLNLNYNCLGPASVEYLVEIMKIKPSIEMLLLQGNPIGNKGLQTLVDGLLDIEYEVQAFKKRESERQGGLPVILPKGRFCQLKELDIGETSITDEGMVDIALLLESNLDLETLCLSSSPDITQPGWHKLAASLGKNRKLRTLTLEHNKIGDAGMEALAEGLKNNTSLNSLDLAESRIGEAGGQALVDLLKRNTSLLNVTLSPGNSISEKTIGEIQRYLALNQASAHGK